MLGIHGLISICIKHENDSNGNLNNADNCKKGVEAE